MRIQRPRDSMRAALATGLAVLVLAPATSVDVASSRAAADELAVPGPLEVRISHMGPDGDIAYRAGEPAVACNTTSNEYLVVWAGDDVAPGVDDEFEIFAQRLDAKGEPLGERLRISDMGPDGDTEYDALSPAVAYNAASDEYLVVWRGDDNTAPLLDNQFQIFAQRLDAPTGAEVGENDFRVNDWILTQGRGAASPALAWNSNANEYLVVWDAFTRGYNQTDIFGLRLSAEGTRLGGGMQISYTRYITSPKETNPFWAASPAVSFNPQENLYQVIWTGFENWTAGHGFTATELFTKTVPADGAPDGISDTRLTWLGLAGHERASIAYNSTANEFFVSWPVPYLVPPAPTAWRIYGQRLVGKGTPAGIGFRLSDVPTYAPQTATIFNPAAGEYLVLWPGLAASDHEIFLQRVAANGAVFGTARLTDMGPEGDARFSASSPAAIYNPAVDEFLVVWSGDDDTAPLVDDEIEIFGRRYGSPQPIVIGLGRSAGEGGWLAMHGDAPAFSPHRWVQVPWPTYNATGGGTHPAVGDIDGDGRDEIVVGFDPQGERWLAIIDDAYTGYAMFGWIRMPWPAFNAPLYPAVGDVDGDGRDEIVVSFGAGGQGWFLVLDDALADFEVLAWRQVSWPAYASADGRTHPAVGDLDGDGTAEIIVGLGPGSNGWLEVFEGLPGSFSHRTWLWVPWPEYTTANGTTWPAAGDLDGDAKAELVVGLGTGGGGFVAVFDSDPGFELIRWLRIGWDRYNTDVGEAHPAVGNVDSDPRAEIVVGLGPFGSEGGWLQVFDDLVDDVDATWSRVGWEAFAQSGGETFPAIGPRRRP